MGRSKNWGWGLGMVGALALAGPLPKAEACGGFFCSRTEINQSGERIVFSQESDGTMTTHVQIQYSGAAHDFAWILPIPSLPMLSVGTNILFDQLDSATAPSFQLERRTEGRCRETPDCPSHRSPPPEYYGYVDGGGAASDAGAEPGSSVSVYFRDAVGPYDAVVLGSDDPDALRAWLADNGYDLPPAALPLLDGYVAQHSYFVALKLLTDRGVGELQPIVLRYREEQACIPIKLTSIATVPDMPITAWVLGRARSVAWNYMNVQPDLEVRQLYMGYGDPGLYTELVRMAVDDAGGQAFVTEYAGPVPSVSLTAPIVEDLRTVTDPGAFLVALSGRGFARDAQLLRLLTRFIPPPVGADPQAFYNCLLNDWCHGYDRYLAGLPFDPNALVDALNEAIVTPRVEAQAMLERQPMITRLFTTMSADEMTEDPLFVFDAGAPAVARVHTADLVTQCSPAYFSFTAPQRLVYPTGGEETIREGIAYAGTDSAYCRDLDHGDFGPYVDESRARATAAWREENPGRTRGCSAVEGGAQGGLLALLALGLAVRSGRRRR